MSKSLVRVEPDSVSNAVSEVLTGTRKISLPLSEKPIGLNDINILSYSIIEEALYDMRPKELVFVAQMASAASLTNNQRNWLKKIALNYIGTDIDAEEETGDFTVEIRSAAKPARAAKPANDNPRKRTSRGKRAA